MVCRLGGFENDFSPQALTAPAAQTRALVPKAGPLPSCCQDEGHAGTGRQSSSGWLRPASHGPNDTPSHSQGRPGLNTMFHGCPEQAISGVGRVGGCPPGDTRGNPSPPHPSARAKWIPTFGTEDPRDVEASISQALRSKRWETGRDWGATDFWLSPRYLHSCPRRNTGSIFVPNAPFRREGDRVSPRCKESGKREI